MLVSTNPLEQVPHQNSTVTAAPLVPLWWDWVANITAAEASARYCQSLHRSAACAAAAERRGGGRGHTGTRRQAWCAAARARGGGAGWTRRSRTTSRSSWRCGTRTRRRASGRASRRTRGRGPARMVLLLPSGGKRARRPVACVRAPRPCSLRPRLAWLARARVHRLVGCGAAGRARHHSQSCPWSRAWRPSKSSTRACSRRWLPRSCPLPRARVHPL